MKNLELVGEHWKENLPGLTFDARLERACHSRYIKEIRERGRVGIAESVMCAILNPKNRKILDVGFNDPSDLILDNFGTWLSYVIRSPAVASTTFTMTDIAPSSQTVAMYYSSSSNMWNNAAQATGTQLQVGSLGTAPARANSNIGTAFGTSPESGRFGTGAGSYTGGVISLAGSVTAGGSGTIAESGMFSAWTNSTGTLKYFMLFHDLISPTVGFVPGNTLTCSYAINM